MKASHHPYHYTPIIDIPDDGPFPEFQIHRCALEAESDLLIEDTPVYFTSIIKASRFLEEQTDQPQFFGHAMAWEDIPDRLILDPCAACGFFDIIEKKTMGHVVALQQARTTSLMAFADELSAQKNYDDALTVLISIVNHLNAGEARAHYGIGLIGITIGDGNLVRQAAGSLHNFDPELEAQLLQRYSST